MSFSASPTSQFFLLIAAIIALGIVVTLLRSRRRKIQHPVYLLPDKLEPGELLLLHDPQRLHASRDSPDNVIHLRSRRAA